jgi:putative transposase
MHFEPNEVYHVYNRGNNKQQLFFSEENYLYFLKKVRSEWMPYCHILAYCLMPNHFHFMLSTNDEACKNVVLNERETHMQILSKTIGKTLSSYTKAIQKQENITGNLFQKKTKAKRLTGDENFIFTKQDYIETCFHYIHLNPLEAKLVSSLTNWQYSSWPDYYGYRNGTLINKQLFLRLSGYSEFDFKSQAEIQLNSQIIKNIF